MLISIDTSAGTSVAIFNEAQELSFVLFDDPFGHAENIGTAIETALAEAKISRADLTGVVVGRGPAPYTGLRVGLAAADLMARSLTLPLYGVMVLDAIGHGLSGRVVVTTDAKRRELFAAGYQDGARVFGPEVLSPDALEAHSDFEQISGAADARKVGRYAAAALQAGVDLSDSTALYLRSPDVSQSKGKRVSG